jgi:hypothetical protein
MCPYRLSDAPMLPGIYMGTIRPYISTWTTSGLDMPAYVHKQVEGSGDSVLGTALIPRRWVYVYEVRLAETVALWFAWELMGVQYGVRTYVCIVLYVHTEHTIQSPPRGLLLEG